MKNLNGDRPARTSEPGIDLKVLAAAAFFVGFSAVGVAQGTPLLPVHIGSVESAYSPDDTRYEPVGRAEPGTQLIMIYLGQASCSQSNRKGLPRMVKEAKSRLQARAEARGWSFAAAGIALDRSIERGLEHLAKFGAFDEVTVGRSWMNSAAFRYLWGDMAGPPSTPQVVVLRRTVTEASPDPVGVVYTLEDERLLARRVGFGEIAAWSGTEARLPEPAPGGGGRDEG